MVGSSAHGPTPCAELLRVLMLPDFDRVDAIGSYWGNGKTRAFAETARRTGRFGRYSSGY
jgi:hypothetical protein